MTRAAHPSSVPAALACLLFSIGSALTAAAAGVSEPAPTGAVSVGGVPTSGTTFAGSQKVLVRAESGTLYLAHVKKVDDFDQVFVARSDDDGQTWVELPQISSGPTNSTSPDLVMDAGGRLRVIWTKHVAAAALPDTQGKTPNGVDETLAREAADKPDKGKGVSADDDDDYGTIRQLFESSWNGRSWTGQRQVTYGQYNGFPSAAYDSRGLLHMVWYGYDGDLYQVMYSFLRGQRWDAPLQVSVGYPDSVNPAIAIDSRDNIHAAWYQYSKAVKSYTISYRERSAASGSWEAQEQLSGDLDTALNVSLAVDRHDRVYVAWEGTLRAQQGSSIFLRVKEDGRWGLPLQVVPASLQASEPSVAIDGADRVYVFYQCGLDSAIHVTRLDGGTILPDEKVGGQAPSGYPNARWSFHDSRSSRHPLEIDYAWTESQDPSGFAAGENFIRVGKVGPAAANERP